MSTVTPVPIVPASSVVNVSVATPPSLLQNYAVNNLVILTKGASAYVGPNQFGIYTSIEAVRLDWGVLSEEYAMAANIFNQSPNILTGGGVLMIGEMNAGETLADACSRAISAVAPGGILWAGYAPGQAEVLAACAAIQSTLTLLFVPSSTLQSGVGELFTLIKSNTYSKSRGFYYSVSDSAARLAVAAYASRCMSTNFAGSNTCLTPHLKPLVGVSPDSITASDLAALQTSGADCYVSVAGLPSIYSSGGNTFFDSVYNLNWYVGALQVAGFNVLRGTSTKIAQTEPGMALLRSAYQDVCSQAVRCGYLAPGAWNSPEIFGDPETLRSSITRDGFFVYSQPVSQQSSADRVARKAPLVQIAAKEAGAIHSSSVIVNINA